jgi:arylsulfatase
MSQRRPNILLITTDQQRYDALGINGNPVLRTPNLDALAASGTNFSRCYVTCPVCIPARRSLISGLHPATHGLRGYRDGAEFNPSHTMPGVLSAHGYQTQLVGKLHLHPQRKRFGYDHMILSDSGNWRPSSPQQRENDYTAWLADQGVAFHSNAHGINGNSRVARPFHLDENYHHTSWVAQQAVAFFQGWRDPSCPWFLHVSFVAPHPPLVPPQAYWDRYIHRDDLVPTIGQWAPRGHAANARRGVAVDAPVGPFPSDEIHDAIAGYYGLINHIDDRIRYLLDAFFEYGNPRAAEPTYILFSSDHGEMLGDHHLFRKSLPYESSAHVPLIIGGRNVDVPRGHCNTLACWEDIMPTVLDLAGAAIPDGLDGRSLVPAMRGDDADAPREAIFGQCETGGHSNHWMVCGRHKYLWFVKTGEEQLFDLDADPRELCDLSADDALRQPLRERMAAHLAGRNDVTYDPASLTPCANRPPRALWPNLDA